MICDFLKNIGEISAAGLFEEENRSLFYRKALGLRRFYESCELPKYNGELLYPCGPVQTPHYMINIMADLGHIEAESPDIANRIRNDFYRNYCTVPPEHSVAGAMYTHSFPNYERILKEGFTSYIPRIKEIEDRDLREGLLHLISGISAYISRAIEYLKAVGASEKLISALEKVPMEPAEAIYEAIVCWNFIMYLDGCDNLGCIASGLYPYYKGEDVTKPLERLFDNLDENEGYSAALGTDTNPLTLQCLKASKGKRRPMLELFVDEKTPDEAWDAAFDGIKSSNGQPAFYNPDALLKGLKNKFNIRDEDIKRFCGGGCTEAMIAGLSNVGSLDAGINLLLLLERAIKTELASATDFEDFYGKYIKIVRETVDRVTDEISNSQRLRAQYAPLPMRTLLIDDCIEKGLDYNNGGARYKWSIINFAGLINVIDSMLVIKSLIFEAKTYTPNSFISLLEKNSIDFLKELRKHPIAFGNDNPISNEFSNRISTEIFSMLNEKKPYLGEAFIPASIQFMSQVDAGKGIGATPDGREAGAPLCDSLGAIFGKDTKGPTALLKSVTSLDLKDALGVPVLNFNINPDFKNETLKALILSYMKLGGIQMQITCISRETLEKAYKNPEDYKNLVVRVGGYSEYFYRLSDELKRLVINRTIQNEV